MLPVIYRIKSDIFDNILVTADAYNKITLQMSTGEYHTHEAYEVDLSMISPSEQVLWYFDDLDGDDCWETANSLQRQFNIKPVKRYSDSVSNKIAPVIAITKAKQRDLTPRERLLKNQRELFGYIAPVISIVSYKQNNKRKRA